MPPVSMIFRPVSLPATFAGQLLLTSMPGYQDGDVERPLAAWNALRQKSGDDKVTLVCLTSEAEIQSKSPRYARSLAEGRWGGRRISHPVPDFDIPGDAELYHLMVLEMGKRIRQGGTVLIHCAAGVGRTGTAAVCVLLTLGIPLHESLSLVRSAGSGPETAEQRRFVEDFANSRILRTATSPLTSRPGSPR